jgi:hypothetical protein
MDFFMIIIWGEGRFCIWTYIFFKKSKAKWNDQNVIGSKKNQTSLKGFFHLFTKVFLILTCQTRDNLIFN